MAAPLAVDKEAVKVLVLSIGVREAARRMQLPVATVAAWSARGQWLDGKAQLASAISGAITPEKAAIALQLPASMRPTVPAGHASGAITPSDSLSEVLAEDERETRLSLSRTARRMSQDAETAPLEQAGDALQVGKLAALVHRWDAGTAGGVSVNILFQ